MGMVQKKTSNTYFTKNRESLIDEKSKHGILNPKGKLMLKYKIDVIQKLQEAGVNTSVAKKTGVFGQATMKKFKDGDTNISLNNLNRLCCILEMQPRDILKYIETEKDHETILSKLKQPPC